MTVKVFGEFGVQVARVSVQEERQNGKHLGICCTVSLRVVT
jgi:hypothetical protein